ncbi:MAG TPA: hypothetical protein VMV50_02590 [Candidatus Paceibacterota bacterium]|nr:hypothetical protein [Candidatus Paceibacterota bacterium]
MRYRRQEAALPPEIIQHDVGARSVKKTACANSNCSERIILSQSCVIFWIPHGDNWNEARDIVRHQWHLRCFGEAAMDFIRSHRMRLYGLLPQAHRTRVITLPT